jgi:hypothetical protein
MIPLVPFHPPPLKSEYRDGLLIEFGALGATSN